MINNAKYVKNASIRTHTKVIKTTFHYNDMERQKWNERQKERKKVVNCVDTTLNNSNETFYNPDIHNQNIYATRTLQCLPRNIKLCQIKMKMFSCVMCIYYRCCE